MAINNFIQNTLQQPKQIAAPKPITQPKFRQKQPGVFQSPLAQQTQQAIGKQLQGEIPGQKAFENQQRDIFAQQQQTKFV